MTSEQREALVSYRRQLQEETQAELQKEFQTRITEQKQVTHLYYLTWENLPYRVYVEKKSDKIVKDVFILDITVYLPVYQVLFLTVETKFFLVTMEFYDILETFDFFNNVCYFVVEYHKKKCNSSFENQINRVP